MSVFKIPFSLSEVIPDASFFRDLTNDQNLLHFSFFSSAIGVIIISFKGEYIGNMFSICISDGFLYMCSEPFVMQVSDTGCHCCMFIFTK